ncbi:MAG: formate acetyltransferase [Deltaproteobacteria bacterium]|nr:formate acetyltransferase [Deltaproteobacteria bacterium]
MATRSSSNILVHVLLRLMAALFMYRPSLKKYLKGTQGWINFSVGVRTETGSVEQAILFENGKVRVLPYIPPGTSVTLIFASDDDIKEMLRVPPNEVLNMLMKNRLRLDGNLGYVQLFNFFVSLLMSGKHQKMMDKQRKADVAERKKAACNMDPGLRREMAIRRSKRLKAKERDPGVKCLDDPYLPEYRLEDFPRLAEFLEIHHTVKPEICHERPALLTDWFIKNGFETDGEGKPWNPELRQGAALRYLMENRKPIIRKNDLIAGTTTTKEIGVVIYPDSHGTMIWGELKSVPGRTLNAYTISDESIASLHHHIFPYWTHRNFREWVRDNYAKPLSQILDERFAVYFLWKTASLSHTILDFPKVLALGMKGIIEEIRKEHTACGAADGEKKNTLQAMILCLEGVNAYAKNLSRQALEDSLKETDPVRRKELARLHEICAGVPENPATTLDEAVNAIWIVWVALHMENTNAGLSIGRLDQWLQPFFEADMAKLATDEARRDYVKRAVELVGCFYMKCTDHLPLVPDIGNYLFGGSSSDQAITLGGVRPDGGDAVCDMTYVCLKVTEILGIRDPNVNARFHPGVNSDAYLKRLCEVNYITAATPSMHNDKAVLASLEELHYAPEDARDWAATGCVEPTISGKHMGHTNCMMMNMVAALEMALNNGRHPLMKWDVGPKTGSVENGNFRTFDDFFNAFTTQFNFLIENAIELNNMLGKSHGELRPTPLLSSLLDGCITSGKDATKGGAKYNSSGAACIGLADVTDSLMAIKKLVFDEKKVAFADLKRAIDTNFSSDPALHAMVTKRVPLFGSGNDEALGMASRIAEFTHDRFFDHVNYRGGRYTAGFWSMSNHVAFGTLTGALPSGRLAGKPFTPGLTPQPHASKNLLDNIRDVSRLNPHHMNNNMAFNVKVVPGADDTHEEAIDHIYSYAKTYFDLGGMQMQFNVVTSDMLRDAMANPEYYRNLLVRISGYNAYFVTLNRDMQMELIERAEYGI